MWAWLVALRVFLSTNSWVSNLFATQKECHHCEDERKTDTAQSATKTWFCRSRSSNNNLFLAVLVLLLSKHESQKPGNWNSAISCCFSILNFSSKKLQRQVATFTKATCWHSCRWTLISHIKSVIWHALVKTTVFDLCNTNFLHVNTKFVQRIWKMLPQRQQHRIRMSTADLDRRILQCWNQHDHHSQLCAQLFQLQLKHFIKRLVERSKTVCAECQLRFWMAIVGPEASVLPSESSSETYSWEFP